MTHLSREELIRWRDEGAAADRDALLDHLAACEGCRTQLSELVRLAPATGPAKLDPAAFVARGVAAYRPSRLAWWRRQSIWLGAAAAVTAALVLAVAVPRKDAAPQPSLDIRGSELLAVAPAGDVDRVTEFHWSSPYAAARYDLEVKDAAGVVILSNTTSAERLPIGPEAGLAFQRGRYTWSVRALDASNRVIATSSEQSFRVR